MFRLPDAIQRIILGGTTRQEREERAPERHAAGKVGQALEQRPVVRRGHGAVAEEVDHRRATRPVGAVPVRAVNREGVVEGGLPSFQLEADAAVELGDLLRRQNSARSDTSEGGN